MPREKNLVPDLQRLRALRDSGTAEFSHVPAGRMVADALTKPAKGASVACEALSGLAQYNTTVPTGHPSACAVTAVASAEPLMDCGRFIPLYCPHFYVEAGL